MKNEISNMPFNRALLIDSVLEFTKKYDSFNYEKVKFFFDSSEEVGDTEFHDFEIDASTGIAVLLIYKILEKYVSDTVSLLPNIKFFFSKKIVKKMLDELSIIVGKDEADNIVKNFSDIFSNNIESNNIDYIEKHIRKTIICNNVTVVYFCIKNVLFPLCLLSLILFVTLMSSSYISYYREHGSVPEYDYIVNIQNNITLELHDFLESEGMSIGNYLSFYSSFFGTEFIVSIVLLFVFYLFFSYIKYFSRNFRINTLVFGSSLNEYKYIMDYIKTKIGFYPNIIIAKTKRKNPFAFPRNNIAVPDFLFNEENLKKGVFSIFHEYYHILSKDIFVPRNIVKFSTVIIVLYILLGFLAKFAYFFEISTMYFLGESISVLSGGDLWVMVFFVYCIIISYNFSELRADYFSYKMTGDSLYKDYLKKGNYFSFFYPSTSQREKYITNPVAQELSWKYILSLQCLSFFILYLYDDNFDLLILISSSIYLYQALAVKNIYGNTFKKIIISNIYWAVSFFLCLFLISNLDSSDKCITHNFSDVQPG